MAEAPASLLKLPSCQFHAGWKGIEGCESPILKIVLGRRSLAFYFLLFVSHELQVLHLLLVLYSKHLGEAAVSSKCRNKEKPNPEDSSENKL